MNLSDHEDANNDNNSGFGFSDLREETKQYYQGKPTLMTSKYQKVNINDQLIENLMGSGQISGSGGSTSNNNMKQGFDVKSSDKSSQKSGG